MWMRLLFLLVPGTSLVFGQSPADPSQRAATPFEHSPHSASIGAQVNVNEEGLNVRGDAASSPSMAIDPSNPNRIVIVWRQFDAVNSNFARLGLAYSRDAGRSWTVPPPVLPGRFVEEVTVATDADGAFTAIGQSRSQISTLRSTDGGATWQESTRPVAAARDPRYGSRERMKKQRRHRNGASTLGPDGTVLKVEADSSDQIIFTATQTKGGVGKPATPTRTTVTLGGSLSAEKGPAPGGTLGELQLAVDRSAKATGGNVYVASSVDPPGPDPLDVMFTGSADGGRDWSLPARVNDDPLDNGAWQWLATMAVAPGGRIDMIWNDSRTDPEGAMSAVFHASSTDGGVTWSENRAITPEFDHFMGWPNSASLGNGCDMVSDDTGAMIAYATTFNREQDIYFLRLPIRP